MEKIKNKVTFEEKGTKITDDLLNNNSEQIYDSARNVRKKGLQQFYTPLEFAAWLYMGYRKFDDITVMDLHSGNGNLLLPYVKNNDTNRAIGIENSQKWDNI